MEPKSEVGDMQGLSSGQPPALPQPPPVPPPSPKWILVAGLIFGALTFVFFAGLVIASLRHPIPPGSRLLIVITLAIGIALSVSFLGGTAAAQGRIPLPGGMDPISFSAAGGIAVFLIVLLVGKYAFVEAKDETVALTGSVIDADKNVGIPRAKIIVKSDDGTFERESVDSGDFHIADIPNLFNRTITVSAKAENYLTPDPQTVLINSYNHPFQFRLHSCYNGVWHETDNYHLWPPGTKGMQWEFKVNGQNLQIHRIDGFITGIFQHKGGNWVGELSNTNDPSKKTPAVLYEPNSECNQIITNQIFSFARSVTN